MRYDFSFPKKVAGGLALVLSAGAHPSPAQAVAEWVSTTAAAPWVPQPLAPAARALGGAGAASEAVIDLQQPQQLIEGFGACFNELGWTSLSKLEATDRERLLREFFAPGVGAGFTICRMPIGANDFSRDWYSYDETPGDFELKNFSVANDEQTLIPFIKSAQRYQPALKLWASPWSPPSWMKYNQHYAATSVLGDKTSRSEEYGVDLTGINNGLPANRQGQEGHNLFIQEDRYFEAYARYFGKFVDAYRQHGITVGMVMPQNEFNSAQVFPSCPWTAKGLARFVGYLGPQMQQRGTSVFFGTMERATEALVDTVLQDPRSQPYIKGVGFQWAGKGAIAGIHQRYPALALYQSEQECGNGKNDWKYCLHTWDLLRHYLGHGANAYLYWNLALKQGGVSRWGWSQNSLVTVDEVARTYHLNHEYYLLKHLSHYVRPGARRLATSGAFADLLAFQNPDKSLVVVARNEQATPQALRLRLGRRTLVQTLPADSFNTLLIK